MYLKNMPKAISFSKKSKSKAYKRKILLNILQENLDCCLKKSSFSSFYMKMRRQNLFLLEKNGRFFTSASKIQQNYLLQQLINIRDNLLISATRE